ncbi:T9SS type A sorting domain-containing protein [Marinifilum flexuosum]|uniref:T9SS type A sorting domain-containing protein n=1 Tax=Marinifilum flexuosum TaxID=1117708 RepID=UPI002492B22D|nr:T9SS type A sorting domain-containing protein [Marinifilum flexuosum]
MKYILLIIIFLSAININSRASNSESQKLILNQGIVFLDSLCNRIIQQPKEIKGLFIKLPIKKKYTFNYRPTDPGIYDLMMYKEEGEIFLRWGNGDPEKISNFDSNGELKMFDNNNKKVILCISDKKKFEENINDETTELVDKNLKVSYKEAKKAAEFLSPFIESRIMLDLALNDNTIYINNCNQIWNIYVGSLSLKNVSNIQDIALQSNNENELYADEEFKSLMTGLSGIYSLANKTGTLTGLINPDDYFLWFFEECSLKIFDKISNGEDIPINLEGIVKKVIEYYVESLRIAVNNSEEIMSSTTSQNLRGTRYAEVLTGNNTGQTAKFIDDYGKRIFVDHFYNLPAAESIFGYNSNVSVLDSKWNDTGLIGNDMNLVSFIVKNNGINQNEWYSFYKLQTRVSFYDENGNLIALNIVNSEEVSVGTVFSSPDLYFARLDLYYFVPQMAIDKKFYMKFEFLGYDSRHENNELLFGSAYISFDDNVNLSHPEAPTGLKATNESGKVSLTWEGYENSKYNIFRGFNENFTTNVENKIASTSTTSYTDDGFTANKDNFYKVTTTTNIGVESRPSNPASILIYGPVPSFSTNTNIGIAPLSVQFNNSTKSEEENLIYEWDFNNDGIIDSQEENPTYIYEIPGTYSVKLFASDGNVKTSVLKKELIQSYESGVGIGVLDISDSKVEIGEETKLSFKIGEIKDAREIKLKLRFNPQFFELKNLNHAYAEDVMATKVELIEEDGLIEITYSILENSILNSSNLLEFTEIDFMGKSFGDGRFVIESLSFIDVNDDRYVVASAQNSNSLVKGENRTVDIYTTPETFSENLFDTIVVDIKAKDVINGYGFNSIIKYAPDGLKFLKIEEGDLFNKYGEDETFLNFSNFKDKGEVVLGISKIGDDYIGVSDENVSIAKAYFSCVDVGKYKIKLEDSGVILPNGYDKYKCYETDSHITVQSINDASKLCFGNIRYHSNGDINVPVILKNLEGFKSITFDIEHNTITDISQSEFFINHPSFTILNSNIEASTVSIGISDLEDNYAENIVISDTLINVFLKPSTSGHDTLRFKNVNYLNHKNDFKNVAETDSLRISFQDPAIVKITSEYDEYNLQDTIKAVISIADINNLYACSISLKYDSDVLKFLSASEGDFLNSKNNTTFLFSDNSSLGLVDLGISTLGQVTSGGTSDSDQNLLYIEFLTLNSNITSLSIQDIELVDIEDVKINPIATVADTIIINNIQNNTKVEFLKYQAEIDLGNELEIPIILRNIGWFKSFIVDVEYNADLISFIDLSPGSFIANNSTYSVSFENKEEQGIISLEILNSEEVEKNFAENSVDTILLMNFEAIREGNDSLVFLKPYFTNLIGDKIGFEDARLMNLTVIAQDENEQPTFVLTVPNQNYQVNDTLIFQLNTSNVFNTKNLEIDISYTPEVLDLIDVSIDQDVVEEYEDLDYSFQNYTAYKNIRIEIDNQIEEGISFSDEVSLFNLKFVAKQSTNDSLIFSNVFLSDYDGEIFKNISYQNCNYKISLATSIEQLNEFGKFKTYPNPCNEYIMIESSMYDYKPISIDIFDVSGRIMLKYSGLIFSGKKRIHVGDLKSGAYILRITSENIEISKSVFIKK